MMSLTGGKPENERIKNKLSSGCRQYLGPVLCVLGGAVLYLILVFTEGEGDSVASNCSLTRRGYGGGVEEYQIVVEGLVKEDIPVTVSVSPRVYTRAQAEDLFFEVMDGMEAVVLGSNNSLREVHSDLFLPAHAAEGGINIAWSSSDTHLMDDTGKIMGEVKEPGDIILTAVLSAEVADEENGAQLFREQFEIPVTLLPPDMTADELTLTQFLAALADEEKKGRLYGEFKLPSEFEGRSLRYRSEEGTDYRMIPLLGVLLAALIIAHRKNQGAENKKKRERELSLDYSDMLSKFVVLFGAGLTVRNVWERMVRDYEEAKAAGRQKERAVYEEMRLTALQMQNGVSEQEAYRNFGRRCALSPYLKFSGLLEQNCRSGTQNLREILQREMSDALEERKNIARRLGEEAGTKLLLPLFMLLGIVMAMIMVPALLMMG